MLADAIPTGAYYVASILVGAGVLFLAWGTYQKQFAGKSRRQIEVDERIEELRSDVKDADRRFDVLRSEHRECREQLADMRGQLTVLKSNLIVDMAKAIAQETVRIVHEELDRRG